MEFKIFTTQPTKFFKLTHVLVLCVFGFMFQSAAQTNPQFYNNNNATTANAFPLNSTASNKVQWIIAPGVFRTAGLTGTVSPSGRITRLYFRMSGTVSTTSVYSNFTISLGQNRGTDSVWATGASSTMPFDTTLTTCFYQATHSLAGITANSWYGITLQNGFVYDPTKSLVVEIKVSAGTGNGIANIATTGWNQRLYAAFSATTGTYNTGCANLGFDIVSITPCVIPHAGNATTSVVNACPNQNFSLSLINDTVQSGLTYQWLSSPSGLPGTFLPMLNDTTKIIQKNQTNTNWYACIVSCGLSSDTSTTVQVTTNSTTFSGLYTIDTSLAISSSNFHSFGSLMTNINCRGISGPVTINFAPNNTSFIETIVIGNIPGISSTNTLTINGNGNTIISASSPVVSFNGAQYITWDSLHVINSSAAGFGVYFGSQSRFITFKNSTINVGNSSTSTTNAGIVISGSNTGATTVGNNGRNITIENNEVFGGYYGITLIGNTGYLDNINNIVRNNKVRDFYLYGIYMLHGDGNIIEGNDINRATRSGISTLYGIYYGQSRNTKIRMNKIHTTGAASYSAYPIYIVNCVNNVGFETEISNNLIYNINQTAGIFYGIYALTTNFNGFKLYHNTLDYEVPSGSSSAIRGFFASIAPNNVEFKNNILNIHGAGTGVKTAIYVSTSSTSFSSNNNVLRVATSSNNNVGFWGANNVTLANWTTASLQDSNSLTFNPVFTTSTNLIPLSVNIDNIGIPISSIPTDITGALRSLSTPDVGAYEFTGTSGDLALSDAKLVRSGLCYSVTDTVKLIIENVIGTNVDFSVDPLSIVYEVSGPINTIDSIILFTGTLNSGNSILVQANNINMSEPGNYSLTAYIRSNGVNNSQINDTLSNHSLIEVKPILSVSPRVTVVNSPADTVILKASSPIFPSGGIKFTEICHWRLATGAAPSGGWPAYMLADDYVELIGIPNSDLAGFTMEEWTGTSLQHSVTFSTGTIFSPNGTMILATGQLGSSVPSPANFYYHTGNTVTHSSTGDIRGYIIKNSAGAIIDAVAFGAYTFPAASGVTSSDWTGATSNVSSAGIRLIGPDLNNATNWAVESAASRQDPQVLNAGVPAPMPGTMAGFNWYHLGNPIDTLPSIVVGPYTTPGTYQYIAIYTNQCGTFTDTATIIASNTVPVKLISLNAHKSGNNIVVNWSTASEINNNYFEILRSTDGVYFSKIGSLNGKGTSSLENKYRFVDENAASYFSGYESLYYRLKQVDFDGTFEYSKILKVNLENQENQKINLYPNPNRGLFNIELESSNQNVSLIKIYDVLGAELLVQRRVLEPGTNRIIMDVNLNKGFYILTFEKGGEIVQKRFVVE